MAGDVVADRYELNEVVGSGGMSSVYRAHDRVLERTVALKVLHDRLVAQTDVVERFSREAKLVAGLSHHNIVAVIDRGEYAGSPFIVLEYISGENLKQLLVRQGPLPVERALELTIEIADGLAFAHQKGFVHRDVKPQNVLLNNKGEAKVTDFGIARPLEAQEGETQTGTVLGTCDYISPEQAQGRRVDERTDIYSLGIVLYELLTGHVPFAGENFVAVAMQHINVPAATGHAGAAGSATARRGGDRQGPRKRSRGPLRDDGWFRAELEACLAELRAGENTGATGVLPVVGPGRSSPPTPRRPRRRRRVLILAAVIVIVACIAGAAILIAVDHDNASGGGGDGGHDGGGTGGSAPIQLHGVSSYDPYGNNHVENPQLVPLATDGNESTFWSTETYRSSLASLGKPGVGIVLDAGAARDVHLITVTSDTPGYTAVIQAGDAEGGPFTDDSPSKPGGATTTFRLNGKTARYYVIWITDLGDNAAVHVNEVTAR